MNSFGRNLIQDHFSLKHKLYLRLFGRPFSWEKPELVLKAVDARAGDQILDVGCRGGPYVGEFAARGATVTGLDIRRDILGAEVPKPLLLSGRVRLSLGDAVRLPFRSEAFTKACLLDCLEHLPDDEAALREMHRVMRRGARLVLTVPTIPGYPPHQVLTRIIPLLPRWMLLESHSDERGHTLEDPEASGAGSGVTLARASSEELLAAFGHYRHYDEASLSQLLARTGFILEEMSRFQKLFESEMMCFHFGVRGFQSPMIYPLLRLAAQLDKLLPRNYPGVMLLAVCKKTQV